MHGHLFTIPSQTMEIVPKSGQELLMKLNQKQGNALNVRTIMHAGIIGNGLKSEITENVQIDEILQNAFLGAITACCRSDVIL